MPGLAETKGFVKSYDGGRDPIAYFPIRRELAAKANNVLTVTLVAACVRTKTYAISGTKYSQESETAFLFKTRVQDSGACLVLPPPSSELGSRSICI